MLRAGQAYRRVSFYPRGGAPLASADYFARPYPAASDERSFGRIAFLLIFAAVAFNAGLSFMNAHIAPINSRTVILSEMLIIGATMLVAYRSMKIIHLCLILGVISYTLTLSLFRANISVDAGLDVKIVRDMLIPIVFFILGLRANDLKTVDSVIFKITGVIFGVAIFEYFNLDTYLNTFNVIQYYIARGVLEDSSWALNVAGGLMVSGIRPAEQGRELLPFLGDHRVSSLFLEPISLGNFGCVVAMWAIVRSKMTHRWYIWTILAAAALIVLADTRFDASFLVLGIFLLLMPLNVSTPIAIAMPIVAMLMLMSLDVVSGIDSDDIMGYGLYSRLQYSGHVLLDFDLLNWFGVKVARLQTFDAGYAYMVSNLGLLGLIAFWWLFFTLKGSNRYFYAFRNASAAYYAVLFCIAASQLTIKTAALHWFLMGALSVARSEEAESYPAQVRGLEPQVVELEEPSDLAKPI
jgi:putative polymerase